MFKEERKALRSEQRARSNEAWQKGQAAMRSGDERHMPPAHAGPVRRFGRDMIDSRFSLASLFMPLALVLFVAMLLQSRFPALALAILLGTYVLFVIMVIDTGLAVHRTRILAQHKFGEDRVPRGFSTQLFSRSFYINDIDNAAIKAEFKDGVLKVDLPKTAAAEKVKQIEIQ